MFPQTSSSSHRRENGMTGPPLPPKDASLASRRRGRQAPGVRLSPGFIAPQVHAESRPNATGRQRLPSGPRGMVASRPPPPPPKGSALPPEDQQALSAGLNKSHPRMSAQRKKPTNRFDLLAALPGMWPGEQGVLPPSVFQKAVPPTYSWVEHRNGRYLVPGESGEFSHPTAPDQRRVANGLSSSRQEHRSEGRREEPVYSDAWRYYLTNPTPATSKSKQGKPPAGSRPRVPERLKTSYIGDYRLAGDHTRTRKPSGERRIDATPEKSNGTLSSRNSPQSPSGLSERSTPPTSLDISPPNKRSLPTVPLFTASPESYSPCYLAPVARTRTQTARLVRNELATEISKEPISTSHEHNVNDELEPFAVMPVAREISTPPLPPTALFIEPPVLQLDHAAAERMAIASTAGRSSSPTYTAVSLSTTVIPHSHPSLITRELWSIRERVKQLETVQYQLSLSLGRSKPPKNALELGWTKETLEQVRRIRSDEKQEFKKVTRELEEFIEVLCIAQTTGR